MKQRNNREHGAATLEFAVFFPLLVLLALGTVDFGRIFYDAIATANATHVGSFYGSQGNVQAVDTDGMNASATASAVDITGVTPSATHYCDCPDSPASGPDDADNVVTCAGTTCPDDFGIPRVFVRSRVVHTFNTLAPYPGVPNDPTLTQNGFMRVQ